MAYQHGINIYENPTSITPPVTADSAVQIVLGTAPIHLSEDPYAAVNKPVLAYTRESAVKQVGYSENFKKYTLGESIYTSFDLMAVAPLVFINVLDPDVHKKAVTGHALTLVDGEGIIALDDVLLNSVKIKNSDGTVTYVKDEDYLISFNNSGRPVVSTLNEDRIAADAALVVDLTQLDPSLVTKTDIIGGYNASTKKSSGAELISRVFPMFGLIPGIILAPGWSHDPDVGLILNAKSKSINGNFKAMNYLDISTEINRSYEEAGTWKKNNGYNSELTVPFWPKVKIGSKIVHYSALAAAVTASVDAKNESVPYESPSNELIPVSATVLEDGTEVYLDQLEANHLNGNGVVTALNWNGWRTWGNNTAIYPNSTDPKDRFIPIRRMFNWWGNTFILTYFSKVDNPTNFRLIESIVDSENIRANGYIARGQMAGAKMEFRQDMNPKTDILNGKITFIQKIAAFPPAEEIVNILEFDPNMLTNAMFGGQ